MALNNKAETKGVPVVTGRNVFVAQRIAATSADDDRGGIFDDPNAAEEHHFIRKGRDAYVNAVR